MTILSYLVIFLMLSLTSSKNLILNQKFQSPVVSPGLYATYTTVNGWECINSCQYVSCTWHVYKNYLTPHCTDSKQIVDLILDPLQHGGLRQTFNLNSNQHLLKISYVYPLQNANAKQLAISWNNNILTTISPTAQSSQKFIYQTIINVTSSSSTLEILEQGSITDAYGFIILQAQLYQIPNDFLAIVYGQLPEIGSSLLPGNRVLLQIIMGYYINIDRLEFYYYHQRNYSNYSWILISNINKMQRSKENVVKNKVSSFLPGYTSAIDSFTESLDFKINSTDKAILAKNSNGDSLITNQSEFFFYDLPFLAVMYTLLYLLFMLLKQWPISLLVRKYYFLLILAPLLFEGGVQQFTYYMTGELLNFYSANFKHKLVNLFLLSFYFIVFLFGVFGFLLFKIQYPKKTYYIMDNHQSFTFAVQCAVVDRGFVAFLFGVVHRLLIFYPYEQLIVLGIIQILWITVRVVFVLKKAYKGKIKMWIVNLSGFLRILFQISFYFYEQNTTQQTLIDQGIHRILIIIFLLLWVIEIAVSIPDIIDEIKKIIRHCGKVQKEESIDFKKCHQGYGQTQIQIQNQEIQHIQQNQKLFKVKRSFKNREKKTEPENKQKQCQKKKVKFYLLNKPVQEFKL